MAGRGRGGNRSGKRKATSTAQGSRPTKRRSAFSVYEGEDVTDVRAENRLKARNEAEGAGADEETLEIDQEDDEEIDEDEAFDSEDEGRFGAYFEGKGAEEEGSEDDEDDEDDEDEDEDEEEMSDKEDLEGSESAGEGNSDVDSNSNSETSETDPTLASLSSFITNLDTSTSTSKKNLRPDRRHARLEQTLPFAESPHAVPIPDSAKPTLADLVAAADVPGLSSLRKQVAALQRQQAKSGVLAAPLPKRVQDRTSRQAARDVAVKEVTKWTPLIKRNREAETLSFPLNEVKDSTTTASLAGNFAPSTELEKEVNELLKGMDEAEVAKAEELEMNAVSVDDIKARRAELAKLRSLLFFQEAKMKKAAKIKSKAYRKIKKKEREAALERAKIIDPEMAMDEQRKAEFERARERVTLRHKNTGKWAKQARKGDKEPVQEQLRRHEALVRRIQGRDGSGSESEEESESEGEEGDERQRALEDLEDLEESLDQPVPGKGLLALKFMQRAAEEQKKRLRSELDGVRDEILAGSDDEEEEVDVEAMGTGRRSFKQEKGAVTRVAMASREDERDEEEPVERKGGSRVTRVSGPVTVASDGANPWLTVGSKAVQRSTKDTAARTRQEKALENLSKERKRSQRSEREEEEDGVELIDVDVELRLPSAGKAVAEPKQANGHAETGASRGPRLVEADEDDSDADELPDEAPMTHLADLKTMSQREIMNLAFATDDVVADFEEEKRELEEESDEGEGSGVLPGWGSWAGKGVKKFKPKAAPKKPVVSEKPKRKDAHLKHVIISEKKPKKALKYAADTVPYPYRTKEQYEASLRMPLGKEWNTATAHKRNIVPSVSTKSGTIIHPLKVRLLKSIYFFSPRA